MPKFNQLKVGGVLSETQYYKVVDIKGDKVQLQNDEGTNIVVNDGYVENALNAADQFTKTEKVTKTKLAEIFMSYPRIAMTVNFNKQVKPEDVAKGIIDVYDDLGMGMTKADFGKKVKAALSIKGEERTMIGRHYGSKDVNGRVHFIDMNVEKAVGKDYDTRQRLVDPRTINFIIVDNVKYQLK